MFHVTATSSDTMPSTSGYELLKQSDTVELPERGFRRVWLSGRRVFVTVVVIVGLVVTTMLFLPSRRLPFFTEETPLDDDSSSLPQCPANIPLQANPPAPVNVWAPLSIDETVAISNWLSSDARGLNLTRADKALSSDNLVFIIEAYRPTKSAALAYLNSPSEATLPKRFARVTIHHGAAADPYIADYLVGPLPLSGHTTMSRLTEIYHRDPIPFNARGFTGTPFGDFEPLLKQILTPLKDVIKVNLALCLHHVTYLIPSCA